MEVPGPPTPLCRSVTAPPYAPCCEERVEWESTGWVRVTRVGRCLFSYGCCFVVGRSHSGQRRWGHVACALYCGPHPLSMHTASEWQPPSTHEAHVTAYHGIPRYTMAAAAPPCVSVGPLVRVRCRACWCPFGACCSGPRRMWLGRAQPWTTIGLTWRPGRSGPRGGRSPLPTLQRCVGCVSREEAA